MGEKTINELRSEIQKCQKEINDCGGDHFLMYGPVKKMEGLKEELKEMENQISNS